MGSEHYLAFSTIGNLFVRRKHHLDHQTTHVNHMSFKCGYRSVLLNLITSQGPLQPTTYVTTKPQLSVTLKRSPTNAIRLPTFLPISTFL